MRAFDLQARPIRRALAALLACFLGHLHAATNEVLFQDDFESYTNTEQMRAAWRGGTGVLETAAPGGGQAVSHDGGNFHTYDGLAARADAGHSLRLTADFYDSATNADKRVTLSLRNTHGASLEMGIAEAAGGYVARIVGFGDAPRTNWTAIVPSWKPVLGWHRFQAVISTTNTVLTLDLNADGTIDHTLILTGRPTTTGFTQFRLGGLPARKSHGGPILVDNIKLECVSIEPVPGAVAVAAGPPTANSRGVPATMPLPEALPSVAVQTPSLVPSHLNVVPSEARSASIAAWWIVGALFVIIALLAGLLWVVRRGTLGGTRALPIAPARAALPAPSAATGTGPGTAEDWRQRALDAEALAEKQIRLLRDKVMPELTEFAKQSLVQGLYTQRNLLLETQHKAQQELAALETRLAAMHLPLQERIRAYEARIAELEEELTTRGEEVHELTQATLLLVRQKLEAERNLERESRRFNPRN